MNLFFAELSRFSARRVTRLMVIVGLLVIAIALVIVAARSRVHTVTDYYGGPSCEEVDEFGNQLCVEPSDNHTREVDDRLDLASDLPDILGGTGTAIALVGVILGASCIGAEFGAGSLSTQLLFEPRRWRVFLTKAAALALTSAASAVVLLLALTAGLVAIASVRGITTGIDDTWVTQRIADFGRLAIASGLGALFGFGVTGITRRTTAATIAFLALGFIVEPLLSNYFKSLRGKLPVQAIIEFAYNPFLDEPNDVSEFGFNSLPHMFGVIGLWIAGLLAISGWLFSRSEIR